MSSVYVELPVGYGKNVYNRWFNIDAIDSFADDDIQVRTRVNYEEEQEQYFYQTPLTAKEIKAKIEEAEISYEANRDYRQNKVAFLMGNLEEESKESLQVEVDNLQSRIDEALKVLGIYRDDADEYLSPEYVEDLDAIIKDLKGSEK